MYKSIIISIISIGLSFNLLAQSSDDIVGIWTNASKSEQIEIYKAASKYAAKIFIANDKTWIGKKVIWDLSYDNKNREWSKGFIQKPEMSHSVNCYISLKSKSQIIISGYHGWRIFGSSETWTKN